ncbi:hypothetical protein AYI74_06065 [Shewanella algae]|nr:hypothetical protein AYI74_06065 [Shewanella algae]
MGGVCFILLLKGEHLKIVLPKLSDIKNALDFGVPLIPHVFGVFLLSSVDRIIIGHELGLSSAGIYMLAVQVSMALNLIFNSINKAYVPWLYKSLSENNYEIKLYIVKNTYLYFLSLAFIAILGFTLAPIVIGFVVGDKFKIASEYIGWLILGQVFTGMYLMVTNYIFYSKETKILSLITILSGMLHVFMLFLLTPKFGLYGACYSFVFCMAIRFLLVWYLAAKKIKMPWILNKESK